MRADLEVRYANVDQSGLRLSGGVLVDSDADRFRPRVGYVRGGGVGRVAGIATPAPRVIGQLPPICLAAKTARLEFCPDCRAGTSQSTRSPPLLGSPAWAPSTPRSM